MKECFRTPLEEQIVVKLKEVLQQISVSALLNTLNLFISTHVTNVSEEEASERYQMYMTEYYDYFFLYPVWLQG